jgi:hypothetical protein
MLEMEQMVSAKEGKFLGVSQEQLENFARRLQTFIETSAKHPQALIKSAKQTEIRRAYINHDKILGVVSPRKLPENGVGSTFLVAWQNSDTNRSGDTVIPMEIWLAKGKSISGSKGFEELLVDYIRLGTLEHGTREIKQNTKDVSPHAKSGSWQIYFDSTVILTP